MVDAPAEARNADKSPEQGGHEAFAFAGLVLDLDACTLNRESGEPIALTRGEFALLRELVRRPGRVLSRDFLLDAVVGRRNAPFDRSVDVMVGRLRKKVEPDPKQPSVIQTVPGEGYRFTAPLSPRRVAAEAVAATAATSPPDPPIPPPDAIPRTRRALWPVLAAAVALCLIAAAAAIQWRPIRGEAAPRFSMVVLPFANLTGEPGWDYLGKDMAVELTTLMGAFPNMHVLAGAAPDEADQDVRRAAARAGARYVIAGALDKVNDRLRYTAQLFDGASGHELWSARYDDEGVDPKAPGPDVATRIYDALAGLLGRLYVEEERRSWSKDEGSLDAYDYYLRGASFFLRFTQADNDKARAIFEEGLKKYPNDGLLQVKLAWCFLAKTWYNLNEHSREDIEQAWAQAQFAKAASSQSHLATYLLHQLMASLYQYHDGDFTHSIDEAKAAMAMAPYETISRSSLSANLANAGDASEAMVWAERAVINDPNPPPWYYGNLAWAYYVGRRYDDALKAASRYKADFPALYAAICVRLSRLDEARAAVADALKAGTKFSIATEGFSPQIEPQRTAYLNDLRAAGVPEN
ncbi:MAG TPA: winged helix-turn-helix domain-containing protein [Roseiarcus sp.]|jgi:TolB-like protein/DNA-binding winged helix-turn-helix (wHTH) protein